MLSEVAGAHGPIGPQDALFSALRRIAQVEMSGRTFKARERQRPEPEDC
ncbi:hypothetical protein AB0B28_20030 [Glycomyces sp. NPDC046736]